MSNLLRAGLARYLKNPLTAWVAVASLVIGVIGGRNAVKYSDGDFSVCMSEDGRIVFANTAHTLSAVDVEKLFDRFYTVNSARSSTGLGLSIAKILVERMHGSLSAEYCGNTLRIICSFPA